MKNIHTVIILLLLLPLVGLSPHARASVKTEVTSSQGTIIELEAFKDSVVKYRENYEVYIDLDVYKFGCNVTSLVTCITVHVDDETESVTSTLNNTEMMVYVFTFYFVEGKLRGVELNVSYSVTFIEYNGVESFEPFKTGQISLGKAPLTFKEFFDPGMYLCVLFIFLPMVVTLIYYKKDT